MPPTPRAKAKSEEKPAEATAQTNGEVVVPRPPESLRDLDLNAYGRALLTAKLCEVMLAAGHVEKRGFNEHHNYSYPTESDVADTLRPELAKRGVIAIPDVKVVQHRPITTSRGRDTFVTEVVGKLTFIDSETGAMFTAELPGAGEDGMDKGVFKATTGAVKYLLMKTFQISTGDDPEREDQNREGARQSGPPTGKGDRPITDKQRKVIFGRARGLDVENEWIPRIIAYATKGRLLTVDDVQTNGQLDYVLGQLAAFHANPEEAMAAIEKWEESSKQDSDAELPADPGPYDNQEPPDDFNPDTGDDELPF